MISEVILRTACGAERVLDGVPRGLVLVEIPISNLRPAWFNRSRVDFVEVPTVKIRTFQFEGERREGKRVFNEVLNGVEKRRSVEPSVPFAKGGVIRDERLCPHDKFHPCPICEHEGILYLYRKEEKRRAALERTETLLKSRLREFPREKPKKTASGKEYAEWPLDGSAPKGWYD